MKGLDRLDEVRAWRAQAATLRVGFVPTMGALHDGHRSLLQAARAHNEVVVVSVFVNPTQFGPGEDLAVYPRDREGDERMLTEEGVDVGWFGTIDDLYPRGFATRVEVPTLATRLCGRQRPGHFAGVSLIVLKLLNVVRPQRAYFGLKDYQQYCVVRQLVADLNLDLEIVPCPTQRESDGLAMSSRNRRLSNEGRRVAPILYAGLAAAKRGFCDGERRASALLMTALRPILDEPRVRLEYLDLVDPRTLVPIEGTVDQGGAVLAVAAHVDGVRLIDNVLMAEDDATTGVR
ncbi:MAG: pantoate--beta-alanine ligase [Planctomycetota bacterium]